MARETSGLKPLFTIGTEHDGTKLVVQGTWVNPNKESSLYGFINLIIDDLVIIKCRVINGANGVFIEFPSNKRNGKSYSQVIPMNTDVAYVIKDIAARCAEEFDK